MITFQEESVVKCWNEFTPLIQSHYEEIAHHKDIELDPDFELYQQMEQSRTLRCYTLRKAGVLIGYGIFFVKTNLHYRQSLQAAQDVLFIHPDYRRGGLGIRLIRYCEKQLTAEGVQVVYHHVKTTNQVGQLLKRLGYELIDEIYGKRLD